MAPFPDPPCTPPLRKAPVPLDGHPDFEPPIEIAVFSPILRRGTSSVHSASVDYICLEEAALDESRLSSGESIFNVVNTMVGSGVLAVPYAYRLTGYFATVLLAVTVAITAFTAMLLGEALELASQSPQALRVPADRRDYGFLAQVAFGRRAFLLTGLFTQVEIWFGLVTFLVMNGVSIDSLMGCGVKPAIVCCTVLASSMVAIPQRTYAYVSLIALFMMLLATGSLIVYVALLPAWQLPALEWPDFGGAGSTAAFSDAARALGLIVFCFAGHPCFPAIRESMREPQSWNWCIKHSFIISFFYYGGFGCIAFAALGSDVQPCLTLSIAKKSLSHALVTFAFFVKIQLTAPLLLRAILVGTKLLPDAEAFQGADKEGRLATWPQRLQHFVEQLWGAALLVLLTAASASVLSSNIAALASLCGSLLVMLTSVLLPVAFSLRLRSQLKTGALKGGASAATMTGWRLAAFRTACALVILFGVVAGGAGTFLAVLDLFSGSGSSA
eukprot:TRINITY_DN30908_c0_g1_i1.p1 TRINITY_DN30908_c0_g1~~TRINITY_DN30908_c0_g1_i1.p1  ORF type:complete len:500 (-),score=113.72 TRINITY_DN30908_c0_g1_i1:62-1561(-)